MTEKNTIVVDAGDYKLYLKEKLHDALSSGNPEEFDTAFDKVIEFTMANIPEDDDESPKDERDLRIFLLRGIVHGTMEALKSSAMDSLPSR